MEEKGGNYFGNCSCIFKERKARVKTVGKTFNLLMLLVSISKCLAERIAKEKGVCLAEAENIVVDCVKDGMKTIKSKIGR